jgi:hypothetical protein
MFNSQLPPLSELPTSGQLVRSTILAIGVASALLVTVVLPSEYGIDPTGVGRILNLTQMGEIKVQLAQEGSANQANGEKPVTDNEVSDRAQTAGTQAPLTETVTQSPDAAIRSDQTEVVLKPGQGVEVKVAAAKGVRIGFNWSVRGGVVNYDTHADAPGTDYHGYGKGKQSGGETGTLVAAFDGKHGWFWRNRTENTVTIVLKTSGAYTDIKRVV